ncbi:MAG TPA: DUF4410 domain-containing protein [Burkholderiales bacterium]|jgi:hypothetical protein|nr:DUF4410 domain-containing protein [Burkholderiales bacterium]
MNRRTACLLIGSLAIVYGCAPTAGNKLTGGARVEGEVATAAPPATPARRVYVEDFALDAEATEPKTGLLGRPRLFRELTGEDPAAHARRIVDEMATSLVKDLNAAGFPAERLPAGGALPADGWLIRGAFTEADSGGIVRRAVIGFGSGKTEMEVQVGVSDLDSPRPTESFLVFGTITDPSRLPGGVVTRNPYVVAAKFVLEKGAPRRDVEHTAQTIAAELVKFRDQVRRGQVTLPSTR